MKERTNIKVKLTCKDCARQSVCAERRAICQSFIKKTRTQKE